MARVLMMSTISPTIEQFNVNNINILQSLGYEVHIATDFTDESIWPIEKTERFRAKMEEQGVKCFQIDFSRSMFKIGKHVKAYRQLKKLMKENEYAFIHTHTPIASVIGRLVAHGLGIKVIYTAHGFHFYTGAPIKNWLIFYPIEWLCSWWTDVLITINKEDYKRASEHFHAKKTVYIPGVGIDTEKFKPRESGREKIRKELGLKDTDIMLLSVGELNENKNHEAVIKALAGDSAVDLKSFKDVVYVIVGKGELEEHLKAVSEELSNNVNINATDIADIRIVGYRNDVADFYDAADIYILPSIREGLNVSLMEAMASGLSIVCSNIRGNTDLIEDKSCLFDPMNIMDIKRAIDYAIQNKSTLATKNLAKIRTFDLSSVQSLVSDVYSDNNHNSHNIITPPPAATATATISPQRGEYRHLMDLLKWQEKRKEIGVPLTAKLLLSVGELSRRKNHMVVVEALQELAQAQKQAQKQAQRGVAEEYWYVIVGRGPLHDELLAADHTGRLKLLGYRTDIVDLLRCCDLFVFPSLQEGLPVALMEAMACGVPCIASRIRGNVDLVTDIDHLFEPTSTTKILNQITLQHKNKSDDSLYSISYNSFLDSKTDSTSEHISRNSSNPDNPSNTNNTDNTDNPSNSRNPESNLIQDYSLKNVTTVMLGIYPPPPPEIIRMLVRIIIREEIGVPQNAFLLVSVGELNKNKNHSVIIKALALLEDRKDRKNSKNSEDGEDSKIGAIHYAIAGSGNLDLNSVAIEHGVEKQVHLLGYRSDISALYMAADVCVFPSIREGLGLAAIEGMASGLPLIVADNRGTRDFVGEENGIKCKYNDVAGFADAINELKHYRENKMHIKNVGESIKFDLNLINAKMVNIYAHI